MVARRSRNAPPAATGLPTTPQQYLADEPVDFDGEEAFVTFNPIGIVLAVMPWNFPFWQVFRFAAPALMAGNGALLKHASNVPGCALAIEEVLHQAGVPHGSVPDLAVAESRGRGADQGRECRRGYLDWQRRRRAGASRPRPARCLRSACSNSAGSDAYLVLEDVDIEAAAEDSRNRAHGERRTELHRGQALHRRPSGDRTRSSGLWSRQCAAIGMGDPAQADTKLGPMVSVKARDDIHRQVTDSIRNGARLLLGGDVPDRPGAWYPATVLADVRPGQPAHDEEVFGPVAAIIAAEDEADAIRIANDSEFGLGSGVLTADLDRGRRIAAQELEAGMSFVNENVRSDPRAPFGGVKHSGYGRECSAFGIREFVNIKTVHVKPLGHAGPKRTE